MAGAADGIAYLYENVGVGMNLTADQAAVAYLYENVGFAPRWSPTIGRVLADLSDRYGVGYVYENVT